jgi:hypothetical protein
MKTLAYLLACCAGFVFGPLASGFHDATSSNSPSSADLARLAEGTHLFRIILNRAGVVPLEKLDDLHTQPEKKVLIVLGDPSILLEPRLSGILSSFMERGGAFLLATNWRGVYPVGEVRLQIGTGVRATETREFAYRQYADCPFVKTTEAGQPLFHDTQPPGLLHRVTTFQPGYFQMQFRADSLSVLATFPNSPGTAIMPFAIGGPYGKRRLLALSDHHVFLNGVLWQPDTDNVPFASNCVAWLTEEGKRDQALFLENGRAQTRFDVPLKILPPPPMPPLDAVVQAVDEGLVGLEEEDHFNRLVRSALASVPEGSLLRAAVIIVTLGLALFGLSRLSHARHRFEPGTRSLAASLNPLIPAVPVLEQREQAQLREGNFWETAQALARQLFGQVVSSAGAAALPVVSISGSWWERHRMHRQVQQLWQLANTGEPRRVSARQLARIQKTVAAVQAALAAGRLRLGP